MPWNENWPLGTVAVNTNKPTGQDNTKYISATTGTEHYWLGANAGKHIQVTMPNWGGTPPIIANEGQLFAAGSGAGIALYLQTQNASGVAKLSQMSIPGASPPLTANPGYTFLPGDAAIGGILLQWGSITKTALTGTQQITFPIPFNVGTLPINFTLCADGKTLGTVQLSDATDNVNITNEHFTVQWNYASGPTPVFVKIWWSAMGIKN